MVQGNKQTNMRDRDIVLGSKKVVMMMDELWAFEQCEDEFPLSPHPIDELGAGNAMESDDTLAPQINVTTNSCPVAVACTPPLKAARALDAE